jgi:uncharacterized protein with HEPN domain
MKDQAAYCRDILMRIEQIERFTAGGEREFLSSDLIQEAVIRCFEVISEIVKRFDPALTAKYPEIAWGGYAGFRDVLIHRYDKIVLPKVWQAIKEDLPPLRTAVEVLLCELEQNN